MKRVIKDLANTVCISQDIEFSEHNALTTCSDFQYRDIQRYNGALQVFENGHLKNSALPTQTKITKWVKKTGTKRWQCESDSKNIEVFVKAAPILNPIGFLKNDFEVPENSFLPTHFSFWKDTMERINSQNNQAYVDLVCAFVVSRFRELDLMPHFPLFYGSASAIATSYRYNLTDEFESYRNRKWFWRGVDEHGASLEMSPHDDDLVDVVLSCPFTKDELEKEDSEVTSELSSIASDLVESVKDELEEVESLSDVMSEGVSGSSEASSDVETEEPEYDIFIKIPNLPVALIYQEAHDGTMDSLLDEEELDGCKHGSKAWEQRWIAWLWQVVAALAFLQRTIGFTHNDLHTNNIVWRKTKKQYIYYRTHKGTIWRVPTYGKIFAIIDFGRAIFHLENKKWLSNDFLPGEDAHGQYNFGPIYDKDCPKITPNYSFDLCRLAISMIDGLYPEDKPDSMLFKLLWSWTLDDDGNTVYEDLEGEERYSGFKLYMAIASDCHNAVPREQLEKEIFNKFKVEDKSSIPKEIKIYHVV